MEKSKSKQLIFVFSEDCQKYETTVLSIVELAKFLDRDVQSVYTSMSIQKKKKTSNLVLKDYEGKKHSIIFEKEFRKCKWYKNE